MKKLLITGFDPFGKHSINPSWAAVRQLPDEIGSYEIHKLNIPTVYEKAAALVVRKAEAIEADVILCVGLANGRDAVTPERIAVNIRSASLADNEGRLCSGQRIAEDGPAAYFATVAVEKMAKAIRDAQIPAAVSNTAGTYVCNDVMYTLLHHFSHSQIRVGFIHVPSLPEQGQPNLPLEQTVRGLQQAILALDTD